MSNPRHDVRQLPVTQFQSSAPPSKLNLQSAAASPATPAAWFYIELSWWGRKSSLPYISHICTDQTLYICIVAVTTTFDLPINLQSLPYLTGWAPEPPGLLVVVSVCVCGLWAARFHPA
jgi:hypothetical protein